MSRNIVIDDKVVGQICYAVSKGVTLASACERVGVSYDVIRQYVTSGRKALAEGKSNRNAEIAKKIEEIAMLVHRIIFSLAVEIALQK